MGTDLRGLLPGQQKPNTGGCFWGCGKWGIHLMTIPWLSGLFSSYFLESSFLENPLLRNMLRTGKETRFSQRYPQCELWNSISFWKIHPHFAPGFVLVYDDCVSWGFPTWAVISPGPRTEDTHPEDRDGCIACMTTSVPQWKTKGIKRLCLCDPGWVSLLPWISAQQLRHLITSILGGKLRASYWSMLNTRL